MPKEIIIPVWNPLPRNPFLLESGGRILCRAGPADLRVGNRQDYTEGLADASGVIKFLAKEGEEVQTGATIATIDESGSLLGYSSSSEEKAKVSSTVKRPAEPQENSPTSQPVEEKKAPAPELLLYQIVNATYSPAVRKLLDETGIDPSIIEGRVRMGGLRAMCSMHKPLTHLLLPPR